MSNELILFKKGIKPAILFSQRFKDRVDLNLKDYYTATFRGSFIVSHTDLPVIKSNDNIKLGIALGYYPKSCELLYSTRETSNINELINFGGIQFNTAFLFDEAFAWCKDKYLKSMLEHFENVVCHRWVNKRESGKIVRETIEIIKFER